MHDSILKLTQSKKTVFDMADLAFIWNIHDANTLKSKLYYLSKNKKLRRLHKGIYVFNDEYDKFELAAKLHHPSYISLEIVLIEHGIIFQYDEKITSASNLSREYVCDDKTFKYRKIKDSVLYNENGLIKHDYYTIATLERAFLDMLYLNPRYHFDNLSGIDFNKCITLMKIYDNNSLENLLLSYKNQYAR